MAQIWRGLIAVGAVCLDSVLLCAQESEKGKPETKAVTSPAPPDSTTEGSVTVGGQVILSIEQWRER